MSTILTRSNNSGGNSQFWRDPTIVRSISTTLLVGAPGNTILVDGQPIDNNDRVLFSDLSIGNQNVYIYDRPAGVFVEDLNTASDGDVLYVMQGTFAGQTYTHNGSGWVLIDQADVTESGYVNVFIGKSSSGNVVPNYSSNHFVVDGTSLQSAIGVLDSEIGPQVTSNTIILNSNTINANTQAIANYVEQNNKEITVLNTTSATVDSVIASFSKWMVFVEVNGTPTTVNAVEIFATHNGVSVDITVYAKLKIGPNITGLTFDVTLTGGNTLNLMVTSTPAINIKAKRISVF